MNVHPNCRYFRNLRLCWRCALCVRLLLASFLLIFDQKPCRTSFLDDNPPVPVGNPLLCSFDLSTLSLLLSQLASPTASLSLALSLALSPSAESNSLSSPFFFFLSRLRDALLLAAGWSPHANAPPNITTNSLLRFAHRAATRPNQLKLLLHLREGPSFSFSFLSPAYPRPLASFLLIYAYVESDARTRWSSSMDPPG